MIDWLKAWLGRGISITIDIPWTGAELEKCLSCGVRRMSHKKLDHPFKEEQ